MRAVVIKSPANAGWGGGKGLIAIYTTEPAVKHQRGHFHQVMDITGRVCTRHVTYTLFRETQRQRLSNHVMSCHLHVMSRTRPIHMYTCTRHEHIYIDIHDETAAPALADGHIEDDLAHRPAALL